MSSYFPADFDNLTCVTCRSHGWVCPTGHPDRMSYSDAEQIVVEQQRARNARRRAERELSELSASELVHLYAAAYRESFAAATRYYDPAQSELRHKLATRCATIAAEGRSRGLVVRRGRLVRPSSVRRSPRPRVS